METTGATEAVSFAQLLRRARLHAGLTQEALAERASLSVRGLSDLERGVKQAPRFDTVALLADALSLTPQERAAFVAAARPDRGASAPYSSPTTPPEPAQPPPAPTLPIPLTPFIGRERELALVQARLRQPQTRLLTLTGPGGTGKTRLSMEVARTLRAAYPDGVAFVALAPLRDAPLVLPAIAQALGLREAGDQPLPARLLAYLRDKRLLLLLDNVEQVTEAAPLVAELLAACPGVTALATSRAALRVRGERQVAVPPLAVPDLQRLPDIPALGEVEAVRLFVERAQDAQPDFALTAENAAAVAEICTRLDGLPLALELAASWSRLLSPQALLSRLERRLTLLTGGPRDLPARQQTLRDTIAWSYDLLEAGEQRLFARLGVFVGSCALEAAEAVCMGGASDLSGSAGAARGGAGTLEALASLSDKSLLRHEADDEGPRFHMLETVREYALERLEARGETEGLRRAHALYYLSLVERVEPELRGPQQAERLALLEREHDNVRAALHWALEDTGGLIAGARVDLPHTRGELGLRMAAAMWRFWWSHGHLSEGRRWLDELLTRTQADAARGATPPPAGPDADARRTAARAKALNGAGLLMRHQGDYERAAFLLDEALSLYRHLGDRAGVADTLTSLGTVIQWRGDYERAATLLEESLATYRELGDEQCIPVVLYNLGATMVLQEHYERAVALFDESLSRYRQRGDTVGITEVLVGLGEIARAQGDYARARALYEESLALRRAFGAFINVNLFINLGHVAHAEGDSARALALFANALREARAVGGRWAIAYGLEGLAEVIGAQGQAERAVRLYAAARALRDAMGTPLPAYERAGYDKSIAALREVLGERAFMAAWDAGLALSTEQAIAEALETVTPSH